MTNELFFVRSPLSKITAMAKNMPDPVAKWKNSQIQSQMVRATKS